MNYVCAEVSGQQCLQWVVLPPPVFDLAITYEQMGQISAAIFGVYIACICYAILAKTTNSI